MKSFVAYPLEFENMLYPDDNSGKSFSGKLVAHFELFKKVSHVEGSVVKCGIAAEEGFTKFAMFRNLISAQSGQKIIAFEKSVKNLYLDSDHNNNGSLQYRFKTPLIDMEHVKETLAQKALPKGLTLCLAHRVMQFLNI